MANNILNPSDWVEPAPAGVAPDDAAHSRDKDFAKQLIRNAVPDGGEPMTVEQLVHIVRGYCPTEEVRLATQSGGAATVLVDQVSDMSAAREVAMGRDRSRGIAVPLACGSFETREIVGLIREVIVEREKP